MTWTKVTEWRGLLSQLMSCQRKVEEYGGLLNMGPWVSRWEEYETSSRILFPSDCAVQEQIQNSSHLFGVKAAVFENH